MLDFLLGWQWCFFVVVVGFRGWLVGLLSWLATVTFGGSSNLKFGGVGKQFGVCAGKLTQKSYTQWYAPEWVF